MTAVSIVFLVAMLATPLPAQASPSAAPSATAVPPAPPPVPGPSGPSAAPTASAGPATPLPMLSAPVSPGPVPSPSAAPAASPSPTPQTSTTPSGPVASPAPAATASVAPTPLPYNYRFVPRQPEGLSAGAPQILAVFLNDRKLRSRGPINIKVETNSEVVKVVSRSNGREGAIPRVRAGDFEATSVLPKIPFIAAGMTVDLEFIATSADGRKATVRVPVRLD